MSKDLANSESLRQEMKREREGLKESHSLCNSNQTLFSSAELF